MTGLSSIPDIVIPGFRLKRPHRKSRSGCLTCKKRRVKCDEKRPRCERCTRRRVECSYRDSPPHVTSPELSPCSGEAPPTAGNSPTLWHAANSFGTTSPTPSVLESPSGVGHDVSDLELAKHYLSHVLDTFSTSSSRREQHDVWAVVVPALASVYPAVRLGMLTVAAACLHFDTEACGGIETAGCSTPDAVAALSAKYYDAAEMRGRCFVSEAANLLRNFDLADASAILVCSRLLFVLALAFFRAYRATGLLIADPESWTWLQMLRGVRTVQDSVVASGRDFDEMVAKDYGPPFKAGEQDESAMCCLHPLLPNVEQTQQARLEALQDCLEQLRTSIGEDVAAHFQAVIDLLREVTRQVCSGNQASLFRTVLHLPSKAPKEFVDMLMNLNPFALALYAHWLMLVVLIEDYWWIGDMGRTGIWQIDELLSLDENNVWVEDLMFWPRRMVEESLC